MRDTIFATKKLSAKLGKGQRLDVEAKFYSLGNQAPYLSITAGLFSYGHMQAGGCMHDEIGKAFPKLRRFFQWHLMSADSPMHYVANTVWHAGRGDFDAARSTALWPEASDDQFKVSREELTALLEARLPFVRARFAAALVELFGFDVVNDWHAARLDANTTDAAAIKLAFDHIQQDRAAEAAEMDA